MKLKATSLLSLSAFAISGLIFTTSCKKSNNNSPSGISASINGTVYQPGTVQAIDSINTVAIIGFKIADTSSLDVEFPDTVSLNKPLNISSLSYVAYSKGFTGFDSWETNAHGTLTVTTLDKTNKKVAGQFSGVLYSMSGGVDSIVITNGQFNASYIAK